MQNAVRDNISTEDLVNLDLVRVWTWWALAWLTIFPLVGLLVSFKFHFPEFLGETSWLTFGRLRPVHVNGVIFGAFTTATIGLLYYIVPKLCGRRIAFEHLGWWALAGWNTFLITGMISLLMGFNLGFEIAEFQWPFNILRWLVLAIVATQILVTIFNRREKGMYVSLWYLTAAAIWVLMNLILGNVFLPYVDMSGISNVALHGLYIHYTIGLWVTPAGLALLYYFLPLSVKNAMFSHKLSLLGFWSLAFLYPFVGTHHYLFSPIPYNNQTVSIIASMLLIIPVWVVIVNIYGTALGRWGQIIGGRDADSFAAKFLLLGTFFYLIGCFQGSTEALRRMQELTHFTDFVISHSHFTVFATFVLYVIGAIYYVWPRVTGRELWSWKLVSWHIWLTIAGTTVMLVGLAIQGFIQGSMLEFGVAFIDSVVEMKPWWELRTLAGATMDIGLLLMVVNLYMTARFGARYTPEATPRVSEAQPAGELVHWYTRPTSIFLLAGIAFFFTAVIVQGIVPSILPQTFTPVVTTPRTGQTIQVADYTEQEKHGREVYISNGCWYCHSQYIRPVTGEEYRWGPVAQAGEYVYDQPQMLSTRRIGPDLSRLGRKYNDHWHVAHHWNPRDVVPDSIMPRFPWLFNDPTDDGQPPTLNQDGQDLIAYLQRLGTGLGDWRETFAPTRLSNGAAVRLSVSENQRALLPLGKQVYQRRCVGCHGVNGDGNGPAARFLDPKPRDFTTGIFKFRSTLGGRNTLPTDADLYITISHGLWGTDMPPWYMIPHNERLAVIQYIKEFSQRWQTEEPGQTVTIPIEPRITMAGLQRGAEEFEKTCALCHGAQGHGDGSPAMSLLDDWGAHIRPANFTLPAGIPGGVKLGHDGRHIYKTIMTGVGGTPMPFFSEQYDPETVWDIVHYVQSLRVDAHIDELMAAGLTEPIEKVSFCSSPIPWLRSACDTFVMPILELCSVNLDALPQPNVRGQELSEARLKIWASLSEAASREEIDIQVTHLDARSPEHQIAASHILEPQERHP